MDQYQHHQQEVLPPNCAICGTTEQLLRCAKCKTIYYCSIAHQHVDWPSHKLHCRQLAKKKNNLKLQNIQQAVVSSPSLSSNINTCINTNADQLLNSYSGSAMQDNIESGIPTTVQSMSVILGTNENEILNSRQALSVSQNSKNIDINSITMDEIQFGDGNISSVAYLMPHELLNEEPRLVSQHNHLHDIHQQQQKQFTSNLSNQNEKSNSYHIGQSDENAIGNANERRYEELCRNIISDMNQYGLSVVDDFLGMSKGLQILNEVHRMYAAGVFQDGQLVNKSKTEQDLRTIRGDKITWVKGVEPDCSNIGYLINQIDAVICKANTMKNNGKLGNYNIKERTKAMVACYPGSGSHYVTHVDNPNKDGRVITAIYYLNVNWDTKRSGGVLRIFPEHGNSVADIAPKFDRLIFFWSDKRNPHEVQPAHRTRYAITVWYFDANEREAALNRCKYQNIVETAIPPTTTTTKATFIMNTNINYKSNSNSNFDNGRSIDSTNNLAATTTAATPSTTNYNSNTSEICR